MSCRTSPPRGGPSLRLSLISNVDEQALSAKLPISLLVGEMSGRTEGRCPSCVSILHRSSAWKE
ncbi:MAG: hypothetical protein EOQ42_04795 [Mesorhizobium sp.]|nr:MAG: hypothetical protein EOQ43_02220 [Mesorhizobium sp.]RWB80329.1 MAG: hypothetical protein EOQ42_04795 [Mesorhizobium sp.]RWD09670.1 MAG: hypothetical protein EOS57_22990 [Mesorhizobium sp.]RWD46302.1 MAG: hypothetical protein EOS35_11110 [Mesorhizobium sp.]TIS75147.1 MAG: hypothetical protein E5W94_22440 [Mesorhizobium sp.]